MPRLRHRWIGLAVLLILAGGWVPVLPLQHAATCGHGCVAGACRCAERREPTARGSHCGVHSESPTAARMCHLRDAPLPGDSPAERYAVDREASRRALLLGGTEAPPLDLAGRLADAEASIAAGSPRRPPTPPPRPSLTA